MRESIFRYRALAEITSLLSEGWLIVYQAMLPQGYCYMKLRHHCNQNTMIVRWNDKGYSLQKNGSVVKQDGNLNISL